MPKANPYNRTCPSQGILALIGGKWSMLILCALRSGPRRTHDLKRRLEGVSAKMLTQTLRQLERNGLVERIDHQTVPPHVEYRLTSLGRSLNRVLAPVDHWAEAHFPKLLLSQETFDQRNR